MSLSKRTTKPSIVRSFRLIDFHIYDEVSKNEDTDSDSDNGGFQKSREDDKMFVIQMFGINEKGDTCCIYVNDFRPFFYVRVGDNWTQSKVNIMINKLKENMDNYYKESILSYKLVDHHKLYGFSGGKKHKFVRISFKNE